MTLRCLFAAGAVAVSLVISAGAARAADAAAALIQSARPPVPSAPSLDARARTAPVVQGPAEASAAPGAGGGPTFLLKQVVFDGDPLLSAQEVGALTAPFLGRRVTFGDLNALTRSVERAVRGHGRLLATATLPAQKVVHGIVHLRVEEGRLGRVKVEGNRHYTERFVQRFFHPYDSHGHISLDAVTRSLLIENEFPDLAVQSVFTRGEQPGTSDITLKVKDAAPLHVDLEYNNFGNRLIGRNRAAIGVSAGSALTPGDLVQARFTEPFPSLSDPFYQFGYDLPAGDRGNRLGVSFLRAKTAVDPTSGIGIVPGTNGFANIYALNYTKVLERTLERSSQLTTSFVAKDVQNFLLGTVRIGDDQTRTLQGTYSLSEAEKNGRWIVTGTLATGLGTALGGISNDDPRHGRAGAGDQFVKANVDALRLWTVGKDDSVLLHLGGQLASDPQVTAEQFAIGGPDSVRGYIQAEELGDDGFLTSLEYRHTLLNTTKSNVQALVFVDHGHVRNENPTAADGPRDLTGAGVGARATVDRDTTLRADLGVPIDPNPDSLNYHAMLYAQVAHRF